MCEEGGFHGKYFYHKNKQAKTKGGKETLGGDGSVYFLDCGDGVMAVLQMSKLIKMYTSNACSSLYLNTSQ